MLDEASTALYRSAADEAEKIRQKELATLTASDDYLGGSIVGSAAGAVNTNPAPSVTDVASAAHILSLTDAQAATIATKYAQTYALYVGCDLADLTAAIQTKPKAVLLGMKAGLRAGLKEAPKSSVLFLRSYGINMTGLALVGKGGKMFKTIRIPKFGLTGVRKKTATSPAMLLLGVARFAWKLMGFGGVPPGFFTRVMMAFFRKIGGIDPNMSLGKTQVATILTALNTSFPALATNYTTYKAASDEYKTAVENARASGKRARDDFYEAMKALNSDTAARTIASALSAVKPVPGAQGFTSATLANYASTEGTIKKQNNTTSGKRLVRNYVLK